MKSGIRASCGALTVLLVTGAQASPLVAQSRGPELAVGVAVPVEVLGHHRSAGPLLRAGLLIVDPGRVWRLRLDGEAMLMPGRPAPNRSAESSGTIRSIGAMASLVIGPSRPRVAPYLVAGAGMHLMHIAGAPPTSYIGGLRGGLGLRTSTGRYRLSLEAAAHLNLSDRGTGRNFSPGSYVPVTVGIAF